MNTNDDFDNKKLMQEIDRLENNESVIKTKDLKGKPGISIENIVLIIIITIIVGCGIYVYNYENNMSFKSVSEYGEYIEDSDFSNYEIVEDDYDNIKEFVYEFSDEDEIEAEPLDYDQEENTKKEQFNVQKKNIKITDKVFTVNGDFVLGVENANKENIYDLDIYAVFYDGENTIVGIEENTIDILEPNKKYFLSYYKVPENFERYELFLTKEYFDDYSWCSILNDEVELSHNKIGTDIEIKVKNNSKEKIDFVDLTVVYYDKNNNIIDIENVSISDIRKNGTGKIMAYGIWDYKKGKDIEVDHYEVILNRAVSYDD